MKNFLFVLTLLFSLSSFSQSPVDKSFPPEELFALGSYYYPEQWDSSQWERDLKKMSEMGIKFTHFAEFAWSMMEPEEGEYHFEWLDRAVSLAEKYGLKVIMCTPTPTPPVWLSKKYGASFWSETYQNFEQVRLPNQQEVPDKANPHAMLDLNRFMADELAGFVNMQADILRRHIHKDQWITTNLIPIFNPVDPVRIDHPDFLTYTRYLVTGHNQGIGSQGFRMGIPEDLGFSNDQFRNRVGKAFGVMELQPGQVNWGVYNPQPLPGAIRMWVYHVFAGGGKFVCNYRFRQPLKGSEQYHYGMIMTDGVTLSPGGEEYVRITQEMKKLRAAYDKKNRMPGQLASRRIGLLFDMSNYWEMEFQRQTDQWRTMAHVHKYYNLLKSFAAPVDVISEKEDFSGYPFLIAPAYQLLDNKLVERWTEYVKKGGHLILTCRTGQKDRDAKLWEAPLAAPIHQLAGINSLYYDHLPHNLYGKIDFEGKEFAWNNWGDVLTPAAGTDVWAVYTDQFYKGATANWKKRWYVVYIQKQAYRPKICRTE